MGSFDLQNWMHIGAMNLGDGSWRGRFFRTADFPVCCIADFPTRRPFANLARPPSADLVRHSLCDGGFAANRSPTPAIPPPPPGRTMLLLPGEKAGRADISPVGRCCRTAHYLSFPPRPVPAVSLTAPWNLDPRPETERGSVSRSAWNSDKIPEPVLRLGI